jgi:hypothetical protein
VSAIGNGCFCRCGTDKAKEKVLYRQAAVADLGVAKAAFAEAWFVAIAETGRYDWSDTRWSVRWRPTPYPLNQLATGHATSAKSATVPKEPRMSLRRRGFTRFDPLGPETTSKHAASYSRQVAFVGIDLPFISAESCFLSKRLSKCAWMVTEG